MQVADFGLAKLTLEADTHVSTRVMGTLGYNQYFLILIIVSLKRCNLLDDMLADIWLQSTLHLGDSQTSLMFIHLV